MVNGCHNILPSTGYNQKNLSYVPLTSPGTELKSENNKVDLTVDFLTTKVEKGNKVLNLPNDGSHL